MEQILKQVLEKTQKINSRYEEICVLVSSPEIIAHNSYWRKLVQEQSSLEELALIHKDITKNIADLEKIKTSLSQNESDDFKNVLLDEISALENRLSLLTSQAKDLLLPLNEHDNKNIIIEIRYAGGGENGTFFCIDLLNMYERFSKQEGFVFEIVDIAYCENGGAKYVAAIISGDGAYARMKHESGVHKANGNINPLSRGKAISSFCTIAILPEVEEIEVNINESDLRIDVFHSRGAGGQNVNKVETAIRITHLPSKLVVTCQDERSQLKNKERAMKLLRTKLYQLHEKTQKDEFNQNRKNQIYSTNKNKIIRTYNYSLCRATDHRINESTNLNYILDGRLETFIDAVSLKEKDNTTNTL